MTAKNVPTVSEMMSMTITLQRATIECRTVVEDYLNPKTRPTAQLMTLPHLDRDMNVYNARIIRAFMLAGYKDLHPVEDSLALSVSTDVIRINRVQDEAEGLTHSSRRHLDFILECITSIELALQCNLEALWNRIKASEDSSEKNKEDEE